MFGKSKRKATAKQYPGIGNLAAFVLTPSKSPKASTIFAEEALSDTFATNTTCESSSADNLDPPTTAPLRKGNVKTGDSSSFWLSSCDNVYVDRACAIKGYRVLSYRKLKKTGKRIVFDILDGKPYYCGVGVQRRITDNAIVFTSRQEALSERFPSNQFEATKSGNGRHPRVLIAFDAWGHCKARHGGIPSLVCEFVRFTKVEEYLDPPHPRVTRLVKRNVVPHNFPGPDRTPPNREVSGRELKIFRMFNVKKRVAAAVVEATKQKEGTT